MLAEKVKNFAMNYSNVETWIAPSFLAIPAVSRVIAGSAVKLGSQTIHGEPKGAFTGEVSCSMLKEFGGTFSLIAHSERRWVLGEIDSLVAKKAVGALAQGVTPLFCVGESLEERERNLTHEVIRLQLSALIEVLPKNSLSQVIIAYEPCWAIGTGKVPTIEAITGAHACIKKVCMEATGSSPNAILYGGSVTPENFEEILAAPDVHGGLIGGASLKAETFTRLIEIASKRH